MTIQDKQIKELYYLIDKKKFLSSKEDLYCYGYDSKEGVCIPDLVVFPTSSAEVSEILKFASRERIFVTPRGAGTGTTGGSVPVNGGIVLCLSKMNNILEINTDDLYAVVEPGVFTGELQSEVLKHGLFYPPDPASSDFCTIGGNLAECAGGPKAVKYGVTKDYVLGLTAVLPTGEIIETGVKTVKGVVGYDLTKLIVGSEGTLGIITKAVLKLLPAPESVKTMISFFNSMDDAAKTVSAVIKNGIIPRVLEYMDKSSIESVRGRTAFDIPQNAQALLIIESDGKENFIKEQMEDIKNICFSMNCIDSVIAENDVVKKDIWEVRKSLSSALFKFGPDKINEDIVVPRSKLPKAVAKIQELQKASGLAMASFGHAGDGNIHFNILLDKSDKIMHDKAMICVSDLFKYVIHLGGTISGEHGVGISKKDFIDYELSLIQRNLIRRIKNSFDPAHILNPGKIL